MTPADKLRYAQADAVFDAEVADQERRDHRLRQAEAVDRAQRRTDQGQGRK